MNLLAANPSLAIELIKLFLLSSTLLLVVGLVAALCRQASAATRHLVWSIAVGGCLALPIMLAILPAREAPVLPTLSSALQDLATMTVVPEFDVAEEPVTMPDAQYRAPAPSEQRSGANWLGVLPLVWVAGVLFFVFHLARTARELSRTAASARRIEQADWTGVVAEVARTVGLAPEQVRLLRTEGDHAPMVTGLIHPAILLPRDSDTWTREQRLHVLHHEAAHLKRRDGLTQIVAFLVTALYWMNPLVWLAARRMLAERESACDDLVLNAGADPTSYAHHLLGMARRLKTPAVNVYAGVAMARPSEMSGRLMAILDVHRNRRSPGPATRTAAVLSTALLTVALAAFAPGGQAVPLMDVSRASSFSAESCGAEDYSLAEIRKSIDRSNRIIEEGVARGDVETMLRPYSPDMVLRAMGGAEGRGLQDMREAFTAMVNNYGALEIQTLEVERISADLVYEIGRYRYYEGKAPQSLHGRYLSVWRYESGRWLVYRDISNF